MRLCSLERESVMNSQESAAQQTRTFNLVFQGDTKALRSAGAARSSSARHTWAYAENEATKNREVHPKVANTPKWNSSATSWC